MRRGFLFATLAALLAGCANPVPSTLIPASAQTAAPLQTPVVTAPSMPDPAVSVTETPELSVTSQMAAYAFPTFIDPASRYLFYLHGKIIEDQGLAAVSPEYGEYEYTAILETLEDHGFEVISEQRPRDTEANAYARRVVGQVHSLLEAGVPAGSITVVGASKGGYIAATVSHLLEGPMVSYALLGTCDPGMVQDWTRRQVPLHGNVLAIYDSADEYAGSCRELFEISRGKGLGRDQEIVLHVGTGHGILYKPLEEWVLPTVAWAGK